MSEHKEEKPKPANHRCSMCTAECETLLHLEWHIETEHTEEGEKLKCDSCQFITKSQETLNSLIENIHKSTDNNKQSDKDIKCIQCDFITTDVSLFVSHILRTIKRIQK